MLDFRTILDSIPRTLSDSAKTRNRWASYERPYPWLHGRNAPHGGTAVLVATGPSLAEHATTIAQLAREGAHVVALGNAAKWLADHRIPVSCHVILDGRAENAAFVTPPVAREYLISSFCDDAIFEALRGQQITLFEPCGTCHQPSGEADHTTVIFNTITIGLAALGIAYALGFRRLCLFGYDSSFRGDTRHALKQSVLGSDETATLDAFGKRYQSNFAMIAQAMYFVPTTICLHNSRIELYGDGLLSDAAQSWGMTRESPQGPLVGNCVYPEPVLRQVFAMIPEWAPPRPAAPPPR